MKSFRLVNYLLPDFGTLLSIAIFFGVLGLGPRMLNMDGDLGRHITVGKFILENGQIPRVDYFSFTMPGESLVPHEWIAQVVFRLAHLLMGLDGVILLCAGLISITIYFIFIQSINRSFGVFIPIALTILGAGASSLHWLARPHLFTFLFFALWLWIIAQLKMKRFSFTWLMPVVMLIWVNTHGAFIAGFVSWFTIGLGWLLERFLFHRDEGEISDQSVEVGRYLLLGGVSSFLVTFLNPAGIETWKTSIGYLQSRYLVGHTAEYLPPDFQSPSAFPFLIMILLLILFLGLRSNKISTSDLLLVTSWTGMSLISARNIPLFVVAAVPVLSGIISDWLKEPHPWIKRIAGIRIYDHLLAAMQRGMRGYFWFPLAFVISVIIFLSGSKLDFFQKGNRFLPEVFPVGAMDWIEKEEITGRIFNYFPWGGYILYRSWPERTVFIDGQTDFYGESLTRQYEMVITASPGWKEVLKSYQVEYVLIPPDLKLCDTLALSGEWVMFYQDSTALLWKQVLPPK